MQFTQIIVSFSVLMLGCVCLADQQVGQASNRPSKTEAPKSSKPNIVHIMVDDLGWQDIASHKLDGKPVYETPNLDRLTKDGRRFTQAYSPAPTCAPSRASFLKGQYPVKTDVYHVQGGRLPRPWRNDTSHISPYYTYGLKDSDITIGDVLSKAGYMTAHVGKWHAGGKHAGFPFPLDQGFQFSYSERNGREKYYNDPELWNPKDRIKNDFFGSWSRMQDRLQDFATNHPNDPYELDAEGRPFDKPHHLALGFIKKHCDKPFFLNYCPYYVHGPIQTRDRERFELYLKKMGHEFPTEPGPIYKKLKGHSNPYYASMVDTVDHMIGEIITLLESMDDPRNPGKKLIENTYVIVDSDNGGVLPYTDNFPLRGGKQKTYEGGVRIPFLVRGPGVPSGSTCHQPISLVDLFPTFMELAGMQPDAALSLDGCNIIGQIHGANIAPKESNGSVRESIFWHFPMDSQMSAAIRKGKWKMVRNYGVSGGSSTKSGDELYQIFDESGAPADTSEEHDVAAKFPDVAQELAADIDAYIAKANARLPYRNPTGIRVTDAERKTIPQVLELDSLKDKVVATFTSGEGIAKITEATLYYTLNARPFDSTKGHREEWFPTKAILYDGRVEGRVPPGATHACFVMRDTNGFMVTSEPLPSYQEKDVKVTDSIILKDGYAYRPGLYALVKYAKQAKASAKAASIDTATLSAAIQSAKALLVKPELVEAEYVSAIRQLRKEIRALKGIEEADSLLINRFPTEPLF